jgi:hypothetical protein
VATLGDLHMVEEEFHKGKESESNFINLFLILTKINVSYLNCVQNTNIAMGSTAMAGRIQLPC